jgi:hypothetical protein
MATYTANIATTQTLSANTVDTVTLTSPATRVTVTCSSAVGAGTVYFTVGSGSATTPTVGGSNAYAVVAGSSFTVDFDGSFPTVKLISSAALTYTVAAASVFNKLADNTVDNSTLQISNGVVSVKDGGIGTSKLDSTVNTYLTNSGLVYVTGASFSAASSVSVNNCFTSTYDNYRLMINITGNSVSSTNRIRFRASGTDTTTNYYLGGLISYTGSAITSAATSSGSASSFYFQVADTTYFPNHPACIEIMQPFLSYRTMWSLHAMYSVNPNPYALWVNGCMNNTTSYDGFTIFPDSGTISGTYRVYGYRQA